MQKLFTICSLFFIIMFAANFSIAQPIYTEDFETGIADPNWEAFFPNEEIVTALSMDSVPIPLSGGDAYVGFLQDADTSYTGVAVSLNGSTSLQNYSIEADVYCYVNHPDGSAYTGVVAYADSSIGTYIKLAADFDPVPYPRIRLYNNHFDLQTFTYTFEYSFPESDIPGGIPTADGWHNIKLVARTINADTTAYWCYFDGNELLGCPIYDTGDDRMSAGQFGFFSFSQGTGYGIPGYFDNLIVQSVISSVDDNTNGNLPDDYVLNQNYPNPFNPSTQISYKLTEASQVSITVHDLLGREIRNLVSNFQSAGNHSVEWNGKDNTGKIVPSGMYLYTLKAGNVLISKKMVLMK